MARKSKMSISVSTDGENFKELSSDNAIVKLLNEDEKVFIIKDAAIKDDFCNYSYEIVSGICLGDIHAVKGKGIIDDEMRNAFAALNVHLACIDDVFKHSGIEISNIDDMIDNELTFLYNVTGFKIKGSKDDEQIILIGNKYASSAGGRIELEMPKVPLDNLSSYKWYNELKIAADNARREVELYKGGKYTTPEIEEPQEKFKQTKMTFAAPEGAEEESTVDDFSNAEV